MGSYSYSAVDKIADQTLNLKDQFDKSVAKCVSPEGLIRMVRNAEQKSEEDAKTVMLRECALIRESLRKGESKHRATNMLKVIYLSSKGCSTNFAQPECVTLVESQLFRDISVGYFAAYILLEETSNIRMLLTNSMKKHLTRFKEDELIAELALSALGSIGTTEMCRELTKDVETIVIHGAPKLKAMAAITGVRCIAKAKDLMESFILMASALFDEAKNNQLQQLSAITLMTEMCEKSSEAKRHFLQYLPALMDLSEHTLRIYQAYVYGTPPDPFLQVAILRLIRVLVPSGHKEHSADLLQILVTIVSCSKRYSIAEMSIVYEGIRTILAIYKESGPRLYALKILADRFIDQDGERIYRYIGLNTMLEYATQESDLEEIRRVAGFQDAFFYCMKDSDITIRRRAISLEFSLINRSNVEEITEKMIEFMASDQEMVEEVAPKLIEAIKRHGPDPNWKMLRMIQTLKTTGNQVSEQILNTVIQFVSTTKNFSPEILNVLYEPIGAMDFASQPLLKLAAFVIGEYAEMALKELYFNGVTVILDDLIDNLEAALCSKLLSSSTKAYLLSCLAKVAIKSESHFHISVARRIMETFHSSRNVELQERSCLLFVLLDSKCMFKFSTLREHDRPRDQEESEVKLPKLKSDVNALFSGDHSMLEELKHVFENDLSVLEGRSAAGLCSEIDGDTVVEDQSEENSQINDSEDSDEDSSDSFTLVTTEQLEIELRQESYENSIDKINLVFRNTTSDPITNLILGAAVMKGQDVEISAADGDVLRPNGGNVVKQSLIVVRSPGSPLKTKIRVSYKYCDEEYLLEEIVDFSTVE